MARDLHRASPFAVKRRCNRSFRCVTFYTRVCVNLQSGAMSSVRAVPSTKPVPSTCCPSRRPGRWTPVKPFISNASSSPTSSTSSTIPSSGASVSNVRLRTRLRPPPLRPFQTKRRRRHLLTKNHSEIALIATNPRRPRTTNTRRKLMSPR